MCEKTRDMKLRNCYNKDGMIIDENSKLTEYAPLQELLDVFESLRRVNSSVPLDKAG